ncbi:hypothetical protein BDQ12DRAFT_749200 [Crucibulum laeve]|uniref:CBS domain-containing protein n=1 Tax=Crucibulum laeve TaxID=68775 RepID=A0A5C3M120_9AGAR|nr:hypothetical protein BDQ12DRAFT_749200 [Crucibulum laeve]
MSHSKRLSQSFSGSWKELPPLNSITAPDADAEEWIVSWRSGLARELIDADARIVAVDAETSVEEACDILLSEDIPCLAIKSQPTEPDGLGGYTGLFDFSDVNAFLMVAATRHTLMPEDLRDNPRVDDIVSAAKAGRVPVRLVSNLSEKNPLETLPYGATLISLLEVFALLIQACEPLEEYLGMVSDRSLLSWFYTYAKDTPSLQKYLSNPLSALALPSLYLYSTVVSARSTSTVLDAMRRMSEDGVSSVAVLAEESGNLLSAVSVTDIGKSNQILSTPLHAFVSQIKISSMAQGPDGSTDGVDKYPVYSVFPSSTMFYTMEKLLATNAHRLFVTKEPTASPVSSYAFGNLSGIVSIVDILSLFARLAKIPNVDPTRMQRHRRASSSSSQSSKSERDLIRSRSSSRTSVHRSPSIVASSTPVVSPLDSNRNSLSLDPLPLQRKGSVRSVKKD